MLFSKTTFIGIDLSGGRHPFTYAVLDKDCQLVAMSAGEVEEVLAFLGNQQETLVAINAPHCPNLGLVRKKMEKQSLSPGHLRGVDMRLAEQELRECGISVSPTSSRPETCAAWMQMGFDFHGKLNGMGFKLFPTENASYQWLETHPHAAYSTLLGKLPLPKPTLEGRLQRQLVLYEQAMGIRDPMGFFEEITRHRLLKGVLPLEYIYTPEELDALVAAFTAYTAATQPGKVTWVGNKEEGQIVLPVTELKESYL
jgi:predicted nuclease with RNAse H fold